MPGTNGIEFIGKIKEVAPDVPIVAISGFPKEIVKLKEQQPDVDFLGKPFPLEKLNKILQSKFESEAS